MYSGAGRVILQQRRDVCEGEAKPVKRYNGKGRTEKPSERNIASLVRADREAPPAVQERIDRNRVFLYRQTSRQKARGSGAQTTECPQLREVSFWRFFARRSIDCKGKNKSPS